MWCRYHALGSCSVKGFFDKKPIEMQMSPLQATILMLFNDYAELAYKELQERVNMPDEDLVRWGHGACAPDALLLQAM